MLIKLKNRVANLSPDMKYFIVGVAMFSFAGSLIDAIFNNYLNESFSISSFQRTILEIPRELPGVLVIFVAAILFFIPSRRLTVIAGVLASVGILSLTFFSTSFNSMLPWLFLFSLGQHIYMPLSSSIGMSLAHEGQEGKRLGQFNAIRNASVILGSLIVFVGFKYLNFSFRVSFVISSICFMVAAYFFLKMKKDKPQGRKQHLKFYKEYRLYYWLCVLFGTRKQIFLTFAPWVLVTVFHQPTQTVAWLLTIGGIAGIVVQPIIGRAIDKLGERFVLSFEAMALIFVCLGYGFSGTFFSEHTAFIIAAICYVADQLLMSAGIARSTYLKKIAIHPSHIAPTLTLAVTIDHVFSISLAVAGGVFWKLLGYQSVFIFGAFIALVNLISVSYIKKTLKK